MEAKALTTQDLTTDLSSTDLADTDLATTDLATTHLLASADLPGDYPADNSTLSVGSAAVTLAADNGAVDETGLPTDLPGEIITTAAAEADGTPFDQFGIAEPICKALAAAGITRTFHAARQSDGAAGASCRPDQGTGHPGRR